MSKLTTNYILCEVRRKEKIVSESRISGRETEDHLKLVQVKPFKSIDDAMSHLNSIMQKEEWTNTEYTVITTFEQNHWPESE